MGLVSEDHMTNVTIMITTNVLYRLIIAVSFSVLIPLVIVTGVLCCVFCCCTNKRYSILYCRYCVTTSLVCSFRNKTVEIVRSPRSVEQSSNNADVNLATIFKQPYSNSSSYNHTYLDAPPSYSDVSKTVQKLPPPYPGT